MGSLCPDCTTATPTPQHHHAAHTERMAWTWTGYDLDAVHRFKEDNFFQTGRNLAEDRFWKTQIHGSDRRGTKSTISLGDRTDTESVTGSEDYRQHYRDYYSYSEPRERSNSVISTISSRMNQFGPSRDYPYGYPEEISEQEEQEHEDKEEESKRDCQESTEASESKKEEKKEEKSEEQVKEKKTESKAEEDSNDCQCSDKNQENQTSQPPEKKEIKEKSAQDDKNFKSNSIRTETEKKYIIAENHISSRFY